MIAPSAAPAAVPGLARAAAGTAAAASGAAGSGAAGDAAQAPADTLLALLAGNAAPFAQAFAALGAGAVAAAGTRADVAERGAEPGSGPDAGKPLAGDAAPGGAAALPDPTLAALAAVLQWLQQQSAVAPTTATTPGSEATLGLAAAGATAIGATAIGATAAGANGVRGTATLGLGAAPQAGQIGAPVMLMALTASDGGTAADGGTASGQQGGASNPPRQDGAAPPLPAGGSLASALAAALTSPVAQGGADAAARHGAANAAVAAAAAGAAAGTDLAAALRSMSGSAAAVAHTAERTVAVAVQDPQWPRAVAAQLLTMAEQKIQAATLRLSPEHLGPVEVRIDLKDARVNVTFTAAHLETRAALEQSIPQLREVFAGSGLTLGQATVQQQARRESQNQPGAPRVEPLVADKAASPDIATRMLGLVDEYV